MYGHIGLRVKIHRDDFMADGVKKEDLIRTETAGSTGTPLEFYWDTNSYASMLAGNQRYKRFAGCDGLRDRIVWIGRQGDPMKSYGVDYFGEYEPKNNKLILSSLNMTPQVLAEYVRKIRRFKPACIEATPAGVCPPPDNQHEPGAQVWVASSAAKAAHHNHEARSRPSSFSSST